MTEYRRQVGSVMKGFLERPSLRAVRCPDSRRACPRDAADRHVVMPPLALQVEGDIAHAVLVFRRLMGFQCRVAGGGVADPAVVVAEGIHDRVSAVTAGSVVTESTEGRAVGPMVRGRRELVAPERPYLIVVP